MNRVFERAGINDGKKELLINERIKVGVAGCGICAGASFVATALALLAARTSGLRVAFVQLDGGLQGIPFGIMPQAIVHCKSCLMLLQLMLQHALTARALYCSILSRTEGKIQIFMMHLEWTSALQAENLSIFLI